MHGGRKEHPLRFEKLRWERLSDRAAFVGGHLDRAEGDRRHNPELLVAEFIGENHRVAYGMPRLQSRRQRLVTWHKLPLRSADHGNAVIQQHLHLPTRRFQQHAQPEPPLIGRYGLNECVFLHKAKLSNIRHLFSGTQHIWKTNLHFISLKTYPGNMSIGKRWTEDDLLVALNLYHKLTFGQFDAKQPTVVAIADKLGRTPGSVAMKLSNFASLDPAMKLRGIAGLRGASRLDRSMWNTFHEDLETFVPESEEAFRRLFAASEHDEVTVIPREGVRVVKKPPQGPTEVTANTKLRRGQDYFRNAVLNNFQSRCGITGIGIGELLIASHILPWKTHPEERLNVRNGICLSRLHDAAFDKGLITFDDDLRLILSKTIKGILENDAASHNFGEYEGHSLALPADAALPNAIFLNHHRKHIFKG